MSVCKFVTTMKMGFFNQHRVRAFFPGRPLNVSSGGRAASTVVKAMTSIITAIILLEVTANVCRLPPSAREYAGFVVLVHTTFISDHLLVVSTASHKTCIDDEGRV